MIQYNKGAFGLNLIFRLHGSAVYRAMFPGVVSVLFYLLLHTFYRDQGQNEADDLEHPYSVGVLVGGVSLLIVFRANYSYSRYWEACTAIHQSLSKWMDATNHTACYHFQCSHYDAIKPPSFFDHPELNNGFYTRSRERSFSRFDVKSLQEHYHSRSVLKSINFVQDAKKREDTSRSGAKLSFDEDETENEPKLLVGKPRLDGGWGGLYPNKKGRASTYYDPRKRWNPDGKGFASTAGGRTPSLFLQELAHLSSLLSAVALSTLRNDIEGAESPLGIFEPGSPWPEVDPHFVDGIDYGWSEIFKYLTGADRSPEARTRHNAARPLGVVGGVSDSEIKHLQMARGPYAKTQLCWQWLSEFITREHIAGSLGGVGAPIISRTMQFLGDGMINYNNARKIMWIPFPFPHAQMSVLYIIVVVFAVPFVIDQYTREVWLACFLSFGSVVCLAGLHEVARELENPFRNVPNDLPLCTIQAQYNEALMVMYAGYHPDLYFLPEKRPISTMSTAEEVKAEDPISDITNTTALASLQSIVDEQRTMLEQQSQEIKRLKELVERGKTD